MLAVVNEAIIACEDRYRQIWIRFVEYVALLSQTVQ